MSPQGCLMVAGLPAQAGNAIMTLTAEGALEHGKLWCLVSHMRKVLWLG